MEIGEQWDDFVAEQSSSSKLRKYLELATFSGYNYETQVLNLTFPDEDSAKKTKGLKDNIIKKLKQKPYNLLCEFIDCKVGSASNIIKIKPINIASKNTTPLEILFNVNSNLPYLDNKEEKNKESRQRKEILEDVITADENRQHYYDLMRKRTEILAGEEDNCFLVSCNWRLRVGGTRGYRELLLPAFHPVFGIPYIPASTLKGAARAWGMKHDDPDKVEELLGMVDTDITKTKAAQVAFLDAYPIKPCLSLDVATPQWQWNERESEVTYSPEPHLFLSLYQPVLQIGISASPQVSSNDLNRVQKWLKNALENGIGSRVSGGYGKFILPADENQKSLKFEFSLWTKGMYGGNPQQEGTEFRPTAVRGVMRYWFRALSMGMYEPYTCKLLEDQIFGALSQPGLLNISTKVNPVENSHKNLKPIQFRGSIYLQSQSKKVRKFAGYLLLLASSIGGVGHGSRRPLHVLVPNANNSLTQKTLRGCHWEVYSNNLSLEYPLVCKVDNWQKFFKLLRNSLSDVVKEVKSEIKKYTKNNNKPSPNFDIGVRKYSPYKEKRRQDVLDHNFAMYLIPCPNLTKFHSKIDWEVEGVSKQLRGKGLVELYNKDEFKGGILGVSVGGKLGIPSYVWIKSMFPDEEGEDSFQIVTIFGVDDEKRKEFAEYLESDIVKSLKVVVS